MTSASDGVYRWLLKAFSAETRRVHGNEMVRQFRSEREVRAGHRLALTRLWLRAIFDVLWHGFLDRCAVPMPVTARSWSHIMPVLPHESGQSSLRVAMLGGLSRDIRWASRRLRSNPGFTLVSALTLALGIGATTAIFSVVYAVLLKPLPFPDPSRVVGLFQLWEGKRDVFAPPNFIDIEARAKSFSTAAAYSTHSVTLTNAGEPVRLIDAEVTSGFFDVAGTPPLLGRVLTRADNEPGHADVIVLGHALWLSHFGGDRDIVNKTITINGTSRHVVGVMPKGWRWPFEAECWEPSEYTKNFVTESRGAWYMTAMARLKPGVSITQAAAEMSVLARQLEREYPAMDGKVGMTAFPILDDLLGDTKRALLVLLAAVGFVLLIACVNVANLVLARAASCESEMAVRLALGAGRWRLVRQVIVESLLLACVGGAVGVLLAAGGMRVLQAVRPPGIPRLDAVALDARVLAFTFVVTLLTGLAFGLLPAWQMTGRALTDSLRERGRSALSGPRGRFTRHALIVAELALAVMLLSGAGLLIRSFGHLLRVNPGFTVGQALTFRLGLPDANYKNDAARAVFYDKVTAQLAAMPGATGVGLVLVVPPATPQFNLTFEIAGRPKLAESDQPTLEVRVADANFFRVMDIPVRRGRAFTADDRATSTPVLMISDSAARRYFPGEDPIGKHLLVGWKREDRRVEGDIVGIVADIKSFGLDREAQPEVYLPLSQVTNSSMAFVVRTAVPPESLFARVRSIVHDADPNLPVNRLETLEAHVNNTVAERRFYMLLLVTFASIALALAGIGIFGVLSFLVSQRTREIGIRMALGAHRGSLVRLIVQQALVIAAIGLAVGTTCGLVLTQLMKTMLFELSPTDPVTFALVDAGLLAVAVIAAWVPTRRATLVDPTIALRAE